MKKNYLVKRIFLLLLSFSSFSTVISPTNLNHNESINHQGGKILPEIAIFGDYENKCVREGEDRFCVQIQTGVWSNTYQISNQGGITGLIDYKIANFEQHVISSDATSKTVKVTSYFDVNTSAPFPVSESNLPADIRNNYLQATKNIQSAAPEIVNKSKNLVQGAKLQAEAVESILNWVIAKIEYDYNAPGYDALTVFKTHRAYCVGFANLSVALLRAAGIPARRRDVCATNQGYTTGPEGGGHSLIEVYYPDVGWVISEPQLEINNVFPAVFMASFTQCGKKSTSIELIDSNDEREVIYLLETELTTSKIGGVSYAANVPDWDRNPINLYPSTFLFSINDLPSKLDFWVENKSCYFDGWTIHTETPWLSPKTQTGLSDGITKFGLNTTDFSLGTYQAKVKVYSSEQESALDWVAFREITVNLIIVEYLYQNFIPLINK
jgi:hypothetical protein